jgi:ABC-2 type transport system ATP-binding protein
LPSRYCLLGASGVGKTTLISAILGIIELDSGEITVFGQKIERNVKQKYSHMIGYMPQNLSLNLHLTVKQILKYYSNIYEVKPLEFRTRFEELKNILELPDNDRAIENCSTGQQRRVSLAVALIHDPSLVILDE